MNVSQYAFDVAMAELKAEGYDFSRPDDGWLPYWYNDVYERAEVVQRRIVKTGLLSPDDEVVVWR